MTGARMRRRVVASMLLLGAVLITFGQQLGVNVASAAATYPRGSIDTPADGASVSGGVSVTGWAVDLGATVDTGVDGVQVYVDGAYMGDAVYGRARPDIAAGFSKPWLTNSGYLFVVDSTSLGGGSHTLEARAHSTISSTVTSYSHTIVTTGPPATPRPTATSTPTALPGTPVPTRTPSPTSTPAPPTSFIKHFGINSRLTWYNASHANIDVDRARAAGLESVRYDVEWDKLEPTAKGAWSLPYLAQLDQAFSSVTSRGLQPLIVVLDTPAWARGSLGSQATPPTNIQDYADMLGFLAQRYASQPNLAFEIWNEPNQITFWDTPGGPDALAYAHMVRASYASIKANAPGATVVVGAIAFNDQGYLQSLYAFGNIVGSYDALSLHPYSLGNAPDSTTDSYRSFKLAVEQTIQTMAQYNQQSKPIWITEMNWSTPSVSEGTRAAYLRRAVQMVRTYPQVAEFMPYLQNQTDGEIPMGLFDLSSNATQSWLAYSLEASVPNSSASSVLGSVDAPVEWAIVSGSIPASGWAVDLGSTAGSGVDRVQVYLDGTYIADASYGSPRTTIGGAFGSRFTNSGFAYQMDLSNVPFGNHTLELRARSTVTGAATSYLRPITVVAVPTHPAGSLDSPTVTTNAITSVRVSGWAVDAASASGPGVDRVQVFLDSVYVANLAYGTSRPDIGASFGARFTNSGFSYQLSLSGVSAGQHTIKVHVRSAVTGVEATYSSAFGVTLATYPNGNLDSLVNGATVAGNVGVSGWALDSGAVSGTGVDLVRVYVDGIYAGTATYGSARADIANASGQRYLNTGFAYVLATALLSNGTHTIDAHARSTVNGTDTAYSRTVNVAN